MPLVLSLKQGQDFFVGDEQFVVDKIEEGNKFSLRHRMVRKVGKLTMTKPVRHTISDEHSTEILPDVFVCAGLNPQMAVARVAIAAPDDILILRGDKKRNPPAGASEKVPCP